MALRHRDVNRVIGIVEPLVMHLQKALEDIGRIESEREAAIGTPLLAALNALVPAAELSQARIKLETIPDAVRTRIEGLRDRLVAE